MAASTLTSRGRVTIPKEIRELLGLRKGDRLVFRLDDRGNVVLRLETTGSLGRLPGLLRHLATPRPVSVDEMNEAVRNQTRRKFAQEPA